MSELSAIAVKVRRAGEVKQKVRRPTWEHAP
jgi:hypothetical protein